MRAMSTPDDRTGNRGNAVALMYHAIDDGHGGPPADPHYSIAISAFRGQLDAIDRRQGGATSVRDWLATPGAHRVLLTFDDGHASDRRIVLPLLLQRGMRADFFVNPANAGRPGYASWSELRELAAAGMSIQSHGYEHRYLTQMGEAQLRESLRAARLEIEERVGSPVTLLAPPGGRMPGGLPRIARECGYSHVLCSRPGWLRQGSGKDHMPLPRVAVTVDVDLRAFERWLDRDPGTMFGPAMRYRTLSLAKSMLGDHRYEWARERMLALAERRA
jgi:peptidoglycan/xylan/chitin deacetylase (PgdA/CDA1 family)